MKKFVLTSVLAFVAVGFVACDSGYVEETRKPQEYLDKWNEVADQAGEVTIPKSYKSEKENTQPPFIVLIGQGNKGGVVFENKRVDEIQSFKVNGGKCEASKIRKDTSGRPAFALLKCDAKSVSKIELDTSAGKFTYKF